MNQYNLINVLDHGYVRLVDSMGDDLSIVRSARVSHNAEWRTGENEKNDAKLIKYLWDNKHTSPFESVEFQFEIKCPIFIARQWHRHRTWSYNEISGRYTELPEEYYVPSVEHIGNQDTKNKQVRIKDNLRNPNAALILDYISYACIDSFRRYRELLLKGCPRELARTVLPLATYTRFFAKVDLRNLLHFLSLRLDSHAQYEIRVYAEAIKELIRPVIPVTWSMIYGGD
jgi:thymidylate synthase (FAD)